jgi:hypothetical protein
LFECEYVQLPVGRLVGIRFSFRNCVARERDGSAGQASTCGSTVVGRRRNNRRRNKPKIVSPGEWQQASDDLLKAEKELTRAQDALAARRRRFPMVTFGNGYTFDTPTGPKTEASWSSTSS